MLKLSQINEGLISKTIGRSKENKHRQEDLGGLSESDYEIYNTFSDWTSVGEYNINVNSLSVNFPSHDISKWNSKMEKIQETLKKFNCKELKTIEEIKKYIDSNKGVIYFTRNSKRDSFGLNLCCRFNNDKYLYFCCVYTPETIVTFLMKNSIELSDNVNFYLAFEINYDIVLRICKEQKIYDEL